MMLSSKMPFFTQTQLELMKTKVFELLEQRGVKMDHPEILKLLVTFKSVGTVKIGLKD